MSCIPISVLLPVVALSQVYPLSIVPPFQLYLGCTLSCMYRAESKGDEGGGGEILQVSPCQGWGFVLKKSEETEGY